MCLRLQFSSEVRFRNHRGRGLTTPPSAISTISTLRHHLHSLLRSLDRLRTLGDTLLVGVCARRNDIPLPIDITPDSTGINCTLYLRKHEGPRSVPTAGSYCTERLESLRSTLLEFKQSVLTKLRAHSIRLQRLDMHRNLRLRDSNPKHHRRHVRLQQSHHDGQRR